MTPHASIALDSEACTACDLCAVECPTWCISLSSHTERIESGPGRPRKVKVLDDFTIDFGLCMYCGICIQVCPFDALAWRPDPVPALPVDPADARPTLAVPRQRLEQWWSADAASRTPQNDGRSGAACG